MSERGMGSLFRKTYKRGGRTYTEPTWTIQFYADGRRVREATHLRNKKDAQDVLKKRLSKVVLNQYRSLAPVRLDALAATVRELYLNDRKTAAATRLAQQWRDHLGPAFGHVLAARLTTDDVIRYTTQRREAGARASTVNRELAALRHLFRVGNKTQQVAEVPYIPFATENNTRTGFVEDADFSRLTAEASELWLRTFLELAYTYGWRKGELLGLRVRQINFTNRTIRLDPGTTKNRKGREVEMTAKVAELLRQATLGKGPEDRVLTRIVKQRIVPVVDMRKAWWNLCVRAGLGAFVCPAGHTVTLRKRCGECGSRKREYRGLIPHDLRRSAAKALRRAGVAESVVMAMGGWKTRAMFERYAIVSSSDQRAAVEALEKLRAAQPLSNDSGDRAESPAYSPAVVPTQAKLQ